MPVPPLPAATSHRPCLGARASRTAASAPRAATSATVMRGPPNVTVSDAKGNEHRGGGGDSEQDPDLDARER